MMDYKTKRDQTFANICKDIGRPTKITLDTYQYLIKMKGYRPEHWTSLNPPLA